MVGLPGSFAFVDHPNWGSQMISFANWRDACTGAETLGLFVENVYSDVLTSMGFIAGKASPSWVWRPTWRLSCVVRGDDCTCLGTAAFLDMYEKAMQHNIEVTLKGRIATEKGGRAGHARAQQDRVHQ